MPGYVRGIDYRGASVCRLVLEGEARSRSFVYTTVIVTNISCKMLGKRLNKEQAFQKLKHYCTYQERSHDEVKQKLYGFGLYRQDVEETISTLIEENYLNEERFAIAFAGGRFRMKQWGRIKIEYELKQKKVSSYCIKKALGEIDEEAYLKSLAQLAKKKWSSLRGPGITNYIKSAKTTTYLLQKGFERQLIAEVVARLKIITEN
jgi:regulatory protein